MLQIVLIVALAGFWIFLASVAFMHGDMARGGMYLALGGVLTVWRVFRWRGRG